LLIWELVFNILLFNCQLRR